MRPGRRIGGHRLRRPPSRTNRLGGSVSKLLNPRTLFVDKKSMTLRECWDLKPGMRLAHPIYVKDRLLVREAAALTRALIDRLPSWGVYRVGILDGDERPLTFISPSLTAQTA